MAYVHIQSAATALLLVVSGAPLLAESPKPVSPPVNSQMAPPPAPRKMTFETDVYPERPFTKADIDCAVDELGPEGREQVVEVFIKPISVTAGRDAKSRSVLPYILPALEKCEKSMKQPMSVLGAVTFHLLGRIAGDHYFARAQEAKIDLPALRTWFAAQPETLRTTWFGKSMDIGFADAELLRMLAELETAKVPTDPMINDIELTRQVLKSLVIEARLNMGLASF
jgi:hypothetical protein